MALPWPAIDSTLKARRARRGAPGSLDDWRDKDYDALLALCHRENPDLPLFAGGHSFAGLVNIAVGSGAMRHNTPAIRRTAPVPCPLVAEWLDKTAARPSPPDDNRIPEPV